MDMLHQPGFDQHAGEYNVQTDIHYYVTYIPKIEPITNRKFSGMNQNRRQRKGKPKNDISTSGITFFIGVIVTYESENND